MIRVFRKEGWEFQYEPREFEFTEIRRGNRFYLPDFFLPHENRFVEVKGFLDKDSKTKLKRFMKYYPEYAKRLWIVVDRKFTRSGNLPPTCGQLVLMGYPIQNIWDYASVCSQNRRLPNWED